MLLRTAIAIGVCLAFGCSPRADDGPPRVLLVGIDGASFAVLDPLIAAGELPTFRALIEGGARGVLRSEAPMRSPALWTTIATGRPRDEHGVLDFYYEAEDGSERLVDNTRRRRSALWNWMGPLGRTVGFAGWWNSWPAEPVAGWIVTDRMARNHWTALEAAPDQRLTSPPELALELAPLVVDLDETPIDELRELARFAPAELEKLSNLREPVANDPISDLKFAYVSQRSFEEISLHLLAQGQPDLTGVFLIANDAISHSLWPYYDAEHFPNVPDDMRRRLGTAIPNFQKHLDGTLARFRDAVSRDTTLLVVSDHGFEGIAGRRRGSHHLDGVWIASGPAIRPGARFDATLYDVAPTVLALLGLPVPDDLPGRVVEEVLTESFLAAHPLRRIPSFEAGYEPPGATPDPYAGDAGMREILRSLGYLE